MLIDEGMELEPGRGVELPDGTGGVDRTGLAAIAGDDPEAEPTVIEPVFKCDRISRAANFCFAIRIEMRPLLARWGKKRATARMESCFLSPVLWMLENPHFDYNNIDFRLWMYGLDRHGHTIPTEREYGSMWRGVLEDFYIVFTASAEQAVVALEVIQGTVLSMGVQIGGTVSPHMVPRGAIPVLRCARGRLVSYCERHLLDPFGEPRMVIPFPDFTTGWLRYRVYALDADALVRRSLAAGDASLVPSCDIRVGRDRQSPVRAEYRLWRVWTPGDAIFKKRKRRVGKVRMGSGRR
jgi:hypothetical protein